MEPVYFRELKEYSKSELSDVIINEDVLNKLIKHSVVKYDNEHYKFDYVGVIIIDDQVINCYPKYILNKNNREKGFKQALKSIKKYKNSNKNHKIHKEDFLYGNSQFQDISFNKLSLMLFFLEDYYENGIYSNFKNILEINGCGEVDWNRTINDSYAIIQNNKPIYMELQTKYKQKDIFDYFKLLHEYIITDCSKSLEKWDLLDIFDLLPVNLSEKSLEDFGDKNLILNKLNKELNVEFNTHKQNLLKSMISYLCNKNDFSNENFLTFYGTKKYNIIWEEMCSKVFKNRLSDSLGVLLNDDLNEKYDSESSLKSIIKKPKWTLKDGLHEYEKDTFIPDIVTFDDEHNFIILDAKYYNLTFNEEILDGQPGIESISKQYFYELAFKEFVNLHSHFFKDIKNAFLFPSYDKLENKGEVTLKFLSEMEIQVIMLPAVNVIELYLKNDRMKISALEL